MSPLTLLNLVTNSIKASALFLANSVVSLFDKANLFIKLDILVPISVIFDELSFKYPKSISFILDNAFIASVEALTLSTLSLPNVPRFLAKFFILVPRLAISLPNFSNELSPVNQLNKLDILFNTFAPVKTIMAFAND